MNWHIVAYVGLVALGVLLVGAGLLLWVLLSVVSDIEGAWSHDEGGQ
jgi:hypothetical protein